MDVAFLDLPIFASLYSVELEVRASLSLSIAHGACFEYLELDLGVSNHSIRPGS